MEQLRSKLEKKIEEKEREINDLHERIRLATAQIEAWQEAIKLFPKTPTERKKASSLRKNTDIWTIYTYIRNKGAPVHISELVDVLKKEDPKKARISLAGSLGSYVRNDEIFSRPEPNTFGLIEWEKQAPEGEEVFEEESSEQARSQASQPISFDEDDIPF